MSAPDHARALALLVKNNPIEAIAAALKCDVPAAWRWIRAPHCTHDRARLCTACSRRARRIAYKTHAPSDDGSPNANDRA